MHSDNDRAEATITWISGPVLRARTQGAFQVDEAVLVGPQRLLGDVMRINGDEAVIQVYEDTTGLRPGEGDELGQSFEDLAKDRFFIGSPDDVAEQMIKFHKRVGMNHVFIDEPEAQRGRTLHCSVLRLRSHPPMSLPISSMALAANA